MEDLKNIAAVNGKSGLFKVLKPGKAGVLVESIDNTKFRSVVTNAQQLSILSEISIYTTTQEGTIALNEVLKKIFNQFSQQLPVTFDAKPTELKAFMKSILPEYDEQRVYVSDIKKLVKWYAILIQELPSLFQTAPDESALAEK